MAQAVRRVGRHQPLQLPHGPAAGPAGGALAAGNTVVLKPSPGLVHRLQAVRVPARRRAPAGCSPARRGRGQRPVAAHEGVDGNFTGSYEVGTKICRQFSKGTPRPAVWRWAARTRPSMSTKADLDLAAEGVLRSASASPGRSARPARGCTWSGPWPASSPAAWPGRVKLSSWPAYARVVTYLPGHRLPPPAAKRRRRPVGRAPHEADHASREVRLRGIDAPRGGGFGGHESCCSRTSIRRAVWVLPTLSHESLARNEVSVNGYLMVITAIQDCEVKGLSWEFLTL